MAGFQLLIMAASSKSMERYLSCVKWYLNEVQSDEEDDVVWYVKKSRSNALVVIN